MAFVSSKFGVALVGLALALVGAACTGAEIVEAPAELTGSEPASENLAEESTDAASFDYSTIDYDRKWDGSALEDRYDSDFPPPLIDPELIVSGGPPPDGIPSIDVPTFTSPADVEYEIGDDEAVIAIEINGDARAYPVQILIWHELVNDEVGGVPVAIAYCPLCNSALAYERQFGERTLDFGTSGSLYQSALVMYDRQTESLWAHFTGTGLVGHYAGAELVTVPVQTLGYRTWADANPDGQVLTRNTGYERRYGQNPYVGYDEESSAPIGSFFNGDVDPRLLSKARVVGINDDAGSIAVRLDELAEASVLAVADAGRNLVLFHSSGLASALDTQELADGREVGQVGVFEAATAGQNLTFVANGDSTFSDEQTNSTWTIEGKAIDGELAGEALTSVTHLDTFWFAWASYRPDTTILEP